MIKVVPFEPEHIIGMDPLMDDAYTMTLCNNKEYLAALKKLGPAFSGFTKDGKCVGAAGVRQINAKAYEGWALLAKDSKKQIKAILQSIDLFIKNYFEFDAADRFQATVNLEYVQGHRFARLLKFQPEGILHNYENGKDYMMYARVNTWL